MDFNEAIQRLEELSVDLDCEELQGIANAMTVAEGKKCPTCAENEMYRKIVMDFANMLARRGIRWEDGRYREELEYRNYMRQMVAPPLANSAHLFKNLGP